MKLELNLEETIVLGNIIPVQGSYTDLIISKGIREKVELKTSHVEEFGIITMSNGGVAWNEKGKAFTQIVDITEREKVLLEKTLKKLDGEEKLPIALTSVYETICLPKPTA